MPNFISSRLPYYRIMAEKKDKSTMWCHLASFRSRVVFLHVFTSTLLLYFLQVWPHLKRSFAETFSPSFHCLRGRL